MSPACCSWVSPKQPLDSRPQKTAQLSAHSQAHHRSSLAPMAGGVDHTPCMIPHALQFRMVAVPFWGLQTGVPKASATQEEPKPAATTTAAPATAAVADAARRQSQPCASSRATSSRQVSTGRQEVPLLLPSRHGPEAAKAAMPRRLHLLPHTW